jgi:pre-mRNA-splicing factor CWC22
VTGLDLVEESDQNTHMIALDDVIDAEKTLDVFNLDPDYIANEEKYKEIKYGLGLGLGFLCWQG